MLLSALLPSWKLALDAVGKSPKAISSYPDSAKRLEAYLTTEALHRNSKAGVQNCYPHRFPAYLRRLPVLPLFMAIGEEYCGKLSPAPDAGLIEHRAECDRPPGGRHSHDPALLRA